MVRFIVLLGPPGAGKGTQAQAVSKKLGLPHISSGEIFRENLKNETELGKLAGDYIHKGELVPDGITINMIKARLTQSDCAHGALLDGFPRTRAQAQALDRMLAEIDGQVTAVPYIKVDRQELINRLTGRWTCPVCGRVYHVRFNPPKMAGICDEDGAALFQRDDDAVETVVNRIRVYLDQTQPLIDYYEENGLLRVVDGAQTIDKVTADLLTALTKDNA
jgi:adenylate kinase